MRVPNNPDLIGAINTATKAWVRHTLGECDPTTCTGTHDAHWQKARDRAIANGWVTES